MKLLTIAVPCYNSAAYMEKCVESLLPGGEEVEIIIVDDGSKDDTAAIGDRLAAEHPGIVRCIHKQNGGHGSAVNTGIEHAKGFFFKVVDSDDWIDSKAYPKVLAFLRNTVKAEKELDMFICNYVYDKDGVEKKHVVRYNKALPTGRIISWDDVKRFGVGQYILMHSVIYRTQLLRDCSLKLPEHTFYVDNIYVYYPLPYVKHIYYLNENLYHYYIGRSDQSVNEQIMIKRVEQQIRVNKIMYDSYDLNNIQNKSLRKYMYRYLEIICVISSILLIKEGSKEKLAMKKELWQYFKEQNLFQYKKIRWGMPIAFGVNLPGTIGRKISLLGYKISQKIVGFN